MAVPPEVQLAWFSSALEGLEAFLLSRDTFRPLGSGPQGMRQDLSLGGLLLARDTLEAGEGDLSSTARAEWSRLRARWDSEQSRHAAAIERKATAELSNRHNLWRAYLAELGEKPDEGRAYPTEVRHRVIIDRLREHLATSSADPATDLLNQLDKALRLWLAEGAFVWSDALRSAYPKSRFWYLYGRPERGLIAANPLQR
ncbi:MAG TPA: hypothetical protein VJ160_02555 [Anaerolineales bacterium]|nr:hypothetical protein [Anaerolineales bacterium]